MARVYKRDCNKCGRPYVGLGKLFCSTLCADNIKHYALCMVCNKTFHKKINTRTTFCSRICADLWKAKNKKVKRRFAIDSFKRQLSPSLKYIRLKAGAYKRNLSICSKEDFISWYKEVLKVCEYCTIPEEVLERITDEKKAFGKRWLTIDRKDNTKGYTTSNMCLSCMRCNWVKSSVLTYDEMVDIGRRYMKKKWLVEVVVSDSSSEIIQ